MRKNANGGRPPPCLPLDNFLWGKGPSLPASDLDRASCLRQGLAQGPLTRPRLLPLVFFPETEYIGLFSPWGFLAGPVGAWSCLWSLPHHLEEGERGTGERERTGGDDLARVLGQLFLKLFVPAPRSKKHLVCPQAVLR